MFTKYIDDVKIDDVKENERAGNYTYLVTWKGLQGTVLSYKKYNVGDTAQLFLRRVGDYDNLALIIK